MNITDPKIHDYLMRLTKEDDRHILEMERIAKEKNFPIVERLVGRLLFLLTKIKKPDLVLELGSGFGYSAYWFAKAMDSGKIVLTDYQEENIEYAKKLFRETGHAGQAEFRMGDAVEIAKEYRDIDILFIDIDKQDYFDAVQTLLPNLGSHALIIADNSLWYGKILDDEKDKETIGIVRFNEYLSENPDFMTTILPLRDGVLLACKLS
jgi:caffeoyl-CoA O-methyltransferase